jgi:endonuclease/exonuclease/phosphatase family metal-dependent hydrolase
MKTAIKIIKILSLILLTLSVIVVMTDYNPDEIESLNITQHTEDILDVSEPIRLAIYNVGFGGLDANQDFFMDGGTGSGATSQEEIKSNLEEMTRFLKSTDSHIYMIQEVDINSKRSFGLNEKEVIGAELAEYSQASATYYKVPFVPLPLSRPLGKIHMDLLTLSKTQVDSANRYTLPNIDAIPYKYFYLDRCMLENTIPLSNGKKLIVLNVHLSAYDSNGIVKKEQLEWIESYIENADLENNYYVFGGDWNLIMTDTSKEDISNQRDYWVEKPKDFKAGGFKWIYDDRVNTVRELDAPYEKGKTFERVIDGYLVSPNIEVLNVETVDMAFKYSDHNPVLLEIKVK